MSNDRLQSQTLDFEIQKSIRDHGDPDQLKSFSSFGPRLHTHIIRRSVGNAFLQNFSLFGSLQPHVFGEQYKRVEPWQIGYDLKQKEKAALKDDPLKAYSKTPGFSFSLKESQQKCTMITLEQAHSKCGLSRRRSKVRQSVFFLKLLLEKGSLSFEKKNRVKFLPWMRDITELEQNALGELMQHFSRPTPVSKIYSSNTNSGISHPKNRRSIER